MLIFQIGIFCLEFKFQLMIIILSLPTKTSFVNKKMPLMGGPSEAGGKFIVCTHNRIFYVLDNEVTFSSLVHYCVMLMNGAGPSSII